MSGNGRKGLPLARPVGGGAAGGGPGSCGGGACPGGAGRRRFLRAVLAAPGLLPPGAALAATLLAGGGALRSGAARAVERIKLRELYEKDLSFSARARALEGERVAVEGYMAPPLKAESSFFVLTRRPMVNCPFCNDASDWPDDIVAVHTKRPVQVVAFNIGIVTTGRLELGDARDPDTGFFSRLRLVDAVTDRVR